MSSKRVEKVLEKETEEKQETPPRAAIEYVLSKPIVSYGEQVSVISMRKPTSMDLLAIGNPTIFLPQFDPPRVEHDLPKVVAMVARLTDPPIPSSSLAALETRDLIGIAWELAPHFIPARLRTN